MWPADTFSQCPRCGELTHQFDRHFPDPLTHSRELYFPVIAYYCPACDHVVVELYHSKADRDLISCTRDADWRVTAPSVPPRPHPAYDSDRISLRAVVYHGHLEYLRSVRQQIGRIIRPDDPEAALQIPTPVDFELEEARRILDTWLRNSKSGTASRLTLGDPQAIIHLTISNRPRFGVQLDRLRRRFALPPGTKLYYFNEGRRFAAKNSA